MRIHPCASIHISGAIPRAYINLLHVMEEKPSGPPAGAYSQNQRIPSTQSLTRPRNRWSYSLAPPHQTTTTVVVGQPQPTQVVVAGSANMCPACQHGVLESHCSPMAILICFLCGFLGLGIYCLIAKPKQCPACKTTFDSC